MSKAKDLNIEKTTQLTDLLKQAKVIVLTDHTGLKVSQINDLRAKIKSAGGEFKVFKNTLLTIALKSAFPKFSTLNSQLSTSLSGPTSITLALTDEVAPLKSLAQFIKTANLPNIKVGLLSDRVLTPAEVSQLASLPSKEILIGTLLGLLNAPVRNLAYVLQANSQKLVYVLSERSKSLKSIVHT